jgi:23S rRNA (guanosine2251-2'-O)-methyltransferase
MRATRRSGELGGEQVEGHHAVHQLLVAARRRTRKVWVAESDAPSPPVERIVRLARDREVPVQMRPADVLLAAAHTAAPQGVIAWADPVVSVDLQQFLDADEGKAPFVLVLDGVTDPGNFGSLLRSAACAGVGGVVVGRHRSAALTPLAVKAAAGAVEYVSIASVGGIPAALQRLSRAGIWVIGLDAAGNDNLWGANLLDGPVALVLGSEGTGLSHLTKQRCDLLARIPQLGPLGSLNVASAAALACFEVARRRAGVLH